MSGIIYLNPEQKYIVAQDLKMHSTDCLIKNIEMFRNGGLNTMVELIESELKTRKIRAEKWIREPEGKCD